MSKKQKNIERLVLSKINDGEIKMKPKWYFVLGSGLLFASLVGVSIGIIFLINLSMFLIRRNSPYFMSGKLKLILLNFPWWIPMLAIVSIFVAIKLLKKYDFSYKKNFWLILSAFIVSIFVAGVLLDILGLNENLARGKMRRFYQRYKMQEDRDGVQRVRNYKRIRRLH